MDHKKICFLLDSFATGGTGRVTSIIGNKLCDIGYDVYALEYSDSSGKRIYDTRFPVQHAYPNVISLRKAILRNHYLSFVKSYLKSNKIDIVFSCGVQFYPVATFLSKICGIKSICWDHTSPLRTGDFRFQSSSRHIGALTSNCNVVLTKQALDIYNKRYPFKKNVHIYNPIDPQLIRNDRYNISSKKIISVGRLSLGKRFDCLIRIAAPILKRHNDWIWDIYGDGPERENLEKLVQQYGLPGHLNLKGQVNDLYRRYGEYSFMVMTSKWEGFPMTLLEGAANLLPLVAFDVPTGPREIIHNGINGYICQDNAEAEMGRRIEELIENPEKRFSMSDGNKEIIQQFDIDAITTKWKQLLSDL